MEVNFFVIINEIQFPSNDPNFKGFGLNLSFMRIFKVIQCPKFHWIWTKPHGTLENVSGRDTTLICILEIYENLQEFSLYYVLDIY